MITVYLLVLCISTWLAVYGLSMVGLRMAQILRKSGTHVPAGLTLIVPVLLFLVVVAANPAMLVAALLLTGIQLIPSAQNLSLLPRVGLCLIAAFLAFSSLQFSPMAGIPAIVPQALSIVILVALLMTARLLPTNLNQGTICLLLCFTPLLAAPFFAAPSFIAVDVALIASGLLGGAMVANSTSSLGVGRQPFVLILGWLIAMAASHGAWIPALASLAVYAANLAYSLAQPNRHEVAHAA